MACMSRLYIDNVAVGVGGTVAVEVGVISAVVAVVVGVALFSAPDFAHAANVVTTAASTMTIPSNIKRAFIALFSPKDFSSD